MKTILLTLLLSALGLAAQDRFITVTAPVKFEIIRDERYDLESTNIVEIAPGETAHLVSLIRSASRGDGARIFVQKADVTGVALDYRVTTGGVIPVYLPGDKLVVNGPAKLLLVGHGGTMATFKITPDQYPPDKTVVVPGGPGGATVTLESSTNLVHWEPAVGGTYTNLPGVKFFRIKMDRIQP